MSKQRIIECDVAVLGAGPAGLSAALWCDDLGLDAVVLEKAAEAGGQLLRVYNAVRNHLGTEAENGRELCDRFLRQLGGRKFALRLNAEIARADLARRRLTLRSGERIDARAVVIATGVRRRRLGVEGEREFEGRGIIDSGKKNLARVAGQSVLIVGGGDAAAENALILAETARSVTLVHRRREFAARAEFLDQIQNNPKIRVLTETIVERVVGAEKLERVEIKNLRTGEKEAFSAAALLIRIGVEPNSDLFRGQIGLDDAGYIDIDRDGRTSAAGVFAAGDVANPLSPTVSTAVGGGATVAKAILAWLNF